MSMAASLSTFENSVIANDAAAPVDTIRPSDVGRRGHSLNFIGSIDEEPSALAPFEINSQSSVSHAPLQLRGHFFSSTSSSLVCFDFHISVGQGQLASAGLDAAGILASLHSLTNLLSSAELAPPLPVKAGTSKRQ